MARCSLIIAIALLFIVPVISAEPAQLVFDFSQSNNTYTWNNSLSKYIFYNRFKCDLNINTNSLLLKKPTKKWQEQLTASFNAEYKLLEGLSIASSITHSRSALQSRRVYTSELKFSAPVKKIKYVDFTPFIANKAIKRIGSDPSGVDKGTGGGVSIAVKPITILYNKIQSTFSCEYYDLNAIPFSDYKAGISGEMLFHDSDSLSWKLANNESVTRYYSEDQTTGDEDTFIVVRQLKIDRRAEGTAKITLPGNIITRASTDINLLKYYYNQSSASATLAQANNYTEGRNYNVSVERLCWNRLKASAGYKYGWGEQDYRSQVLDQWLETGELSFSCVAQLSKADSLSLDGILGVNSYYGLHTTSQNERDVRSEVFNVKLKHRFSPILSGEIRGAYSSFYQIYISSLSSANNCENETYLVKSSLSWIAYPWMTVEQAFTIQANYIMYDYIESVTNTPNRIFRRALTETKIALKVSDRFTLVPGYTYRYEDYGKLIYEEDNWQMATGWDRRYHNWTIKFGYKLSPQFSIEPEYSYELKKEYNHVVESSDSTSTEDEIVREERLYDTKQTIGLKIVWELGQNEYLNFSYSRREWDIRGSSKDISEFFSVSVRYLF